MRNWIIIGTACLVCSACASISSPAAPEQPKLPPARIIFVAPSGQADADGGEQHPLASLRQAVALAKPGDCIRIAAGTYNEDKTITLATKATECQPIRIEATGGGRAVLDFSAQAEDKNKSHGVELYGDYWVLHGIEVCHAGSFGFLITGSHNTLQFCVSRENRNSGTQIYTGGSYTLIEDCQSYRNFDPKTYGEDADGFTAKHAVGPGNVFRRCLSYQNADDGWDLWMSPNPVVIEDCVSFHNGYNIFNIYPFEGDGNGFKFGGNYVPTAHICRRCVSIENPLHGFDQNHNVGPITIEDCVAIRCGKGFSFPELVTTGVVTLRRCTSFGCQNELEPQIVVDDCHWYPTVATGVLGPLPRPGHRDIPGAGVVPATSPAPNLVPDGAPEWGYPSDTPPNRDPEVVDWIKMGRPATRP